MDQYHSRKHTVLENTNEALAGGLIGARLAKRLSGTQGRLTTVFAGLIFVVAAYMLWQSPAVF